MMEARADFLSIPFSSWVIGVNSQIEALNKREMRLREINYSLNRANLVLVDEGSEPVCRLPFNCQYPIGTAIRTRFGMGIVTGFRSTDGFYQISLNFDLDTQKFTTKAYMIAADLSPVYQKGAKGLLISIAVPNMKDSKTRLKPGNNIAGSMVWSPYGVATVLFHRSSDDCMVVKTKWGATAYLRRKGNTCYKIMEIKLSSPVGLVQISEPPTSPLALMPLATPPTTLSPFSLRRSALSPQNNQYYFPQWLSWNRRPFQLSMGDKVATPMGKATVVKVLERIPVMVEVTLDDWTLNYGTKAKGYFNLSSIKEVEERRPKAFSTSNILQNTSLNQQPQRAVSFLRSLMVNQAISAPTALTQKLLQVVNPTPQYRVMDYVSIPSFKICQIESINSNPHLPGSFIYSLRSMDDNIPYIKIHVDGSCIKPCVVAGIGQPVLTPYGVGIVIDVRMNGIHVVQTSWSKLYLNPNSVLKPLRHNIGQSVLVKPYGVGIVQGYRAKDDFYIIAMKDFGGNTIAVLYCKDSDAMIAVPSSNPIVVRSIPPMSGRATFSLFDPRSWI